MACATLVQHGYSYIGKDIFTSGITGEPLQVGCWVSVGVRGEGGRESGFVDGSRKGGWVGGYVSDYG